MSAEEEEQVFFFFGGGGDVATGRLLMLYCIGLMTWIQQVIKEKASCLEGVMMRWLQEELEAANSGCV